MSTTTNHYWMSEVPDINRLRIGELILPGSHDSGSDKQAPNFQWPQEITQDFAPFHQLRHGIRALDLRVAFYGKYPRGDARRFQLFHKTSSGRTVAGDILNALKTFYADKRASKEIVVLDFHEFRDFTAEAHSELQALILSMLGERLVSEKWAGLTLDELYTTHPGANVVAAYNHYTSSTSLWEGVDQRWSGKNLISTADLKHFMDSTITRYKARNALVAIQCAKYVLPLHVPDDFKEEINQWFKSEHAESYIQNFFIINTDWATRSELVNNCKHANQVKAQRVT